MAQAQRAGALPGQDAAATEALLPKPNMANYGATNQAARRREDDADMNASQGLGVMALLRNPRNRLYLATAVAATPFLISFSFYVMQFSFLGQFLIGILCGLCMQGVYLLYCLHRTHQRKSRVCPLVSFRGLSTLKCQCNLDGKESMDSSVVDYICDGTTFFELLFVDF